MPVDKGLHIETETGLLNMCVLTVPVDKAYIKTETVLLNMCVLTVPVDKA